MTKYLQKLGKSLMLPVAVLPAAAILMGIGYAIDPYGWGSNSVIAAFLIKSGSAILDNIAILFALGVAIGMSKDNHGAAALSGLVGYKIVTTLLSPEAVSMLTKVALEEVNPGFGKIENALIGILVGITAAWAYNKFSTVQLPMALAFFSGRRSVPIVTSVLSMGLSVILLFIWPTVYSALVSFGTAISKLGVVGAGLFGFFNRLLIPTGLHHAVNAVFWFDVIDINDIGSFWSNTGTKGVTGMYLAGFFPVMMFGLPAACLAMYHTAKDSKKKATASLLLAASIAAFVTGVTEPIEFSFMFLAPGLYFVHAVLTGLSLAIAAAFQWTAGFMFSGGAIDFVLSSRLPMANKPYMLILQGLVFAVIYYVLFRFIITKFNLKTPGREDDDENEGENKARLANNDFTSMAAIILAGLGGKENIDILDNCVTRLRIEVKDMSKVDDDKIKTSGITGIRKPGKTSVQVIIGTKVQFVADEMKKMI